MEIREMTNEQLVENSQAIQAEVVDRLKEAHRTSSWFMQGYASWAAYVEHEFGGIPLTPSKDTRKKIIADYRLAGMSTRAIAVATNLSDRTIRKELEGADLPADLKVWGTDGSWHQAKNIKDEEAE